MKFQRIQDLRIDNDLTIKEISAMLGLHRDVYSRYEKGLRDFPIDILIKLADIYHCSMTCISVSPPPDFMLLIVFSSTFISIGFET